MIGCCRKTDITTQNTTNDDKTKIKMSKITSL